MPRVAAVVATLAPGTADAAPPTEAGRVIDGVSSTAGLEQTVVVHGGSIAVGKLGERVGVPGDPLEDISVMEHVVFVMKDNNVHEAP
jgi:hypothetical protein